MELGRVRSKVFVLQLLHARQSTYPDESMEPDNHGADVVCNFYYILGSLPSRKNLWI